MKKKKIGFIGLGTMGKPMAQNLLKAGHELYVCDINIEATKEIQAQGAQIVDQPCNVAKTSEVVMTMLPDVPEVEQVYLDDKGLLAGARKDLILIDSSTIDPQTTRRIGAKAAKGGVSMLDAPVGGGPVNAIKGNLIMLVGGDSNVMESCRDIFETVGDRIIYCGPLGSGVTIKLTNNLMMAIYLFSFIEGFSLAKHAGIDKEKLLNLLRENLVGFFERHTKNIMAEDFQGGFKVKLGQKDVRLALKMAEGLNVPQPFAALTNEMFQFAINKGLADMDWTSVLSLYKK
ncbi:MAG: NAD(P)-dependent oxidoreductase [Candidatus Ranarchaeia archaeon]|jgi:2-hydroxy-3-oxopropionate reductase